MSSANPATTIITVTYNASDFISSYLDAIARVFDELSSLSLVIVDNDSADDTIALIKAFVEAHRLRDRVSIVASDENLGFGRGCNLGAAEAKEKFNAELFWFLNPDTVVDKKAATELLALVQSGSGDFVGSSLCDESNKVRSGAFRFPSALTVLLSTSLLGVLARMFPGKGSTIALSDVPVEADWLTGASFMVTKKVFDALEGFDSAYFLYFEEVDLFFRAKQNGYKVISTSSSVVYHASGASTGMNKHEVETKAKRRPPFWFESRRYFYIKNYGTVGFLLTDCAFIVGSLIRKIKNKLNGKPNTDPEKLLQDILAHSLIVKGTKR